MYAKVGEDPPSFAVAPVGRRQVQLNANVRWLVDPETLFRSLLAEYPEEIDLRETIFHENGGATISKLIEVHDLTETKYTGVSDEHEAMGWSVFQALHALAKNLITEGVLALQTKDLKYSDVSRHYAANLQSILEDKNASAR